MPSARARALYTAHRFARKCARQSRTEPIRTPQYAHMPQSSAARSAPRSTSATPGVPVLVRSARPHRPHHASQCASGPTHPGVRAKHRTHRAI